MTRRLSITSATNPRLKALRRLRRRGSPDAFLVEGYRQLAHALDAGADVREVYSAPALHLWPAEAALVAGAAQRGVESWRSARAHFAPSPAPRVPTVCSR